MTVFGKIRQWQRNGAGIGPDIQYYCFPGQVEKPAGGNMLLKGTEYEQGKIDSLDQVYFIKYTATFNRMMVFAHKRFDHPVKASGHQYF